MKELEAKLSQFEESEELFPAIGILDQLIEADPENLDYRFRLGVSCARVGQVERAETVLRECIAAGLDTPVAHLNLGHALKAMGKKDEAVECYRLVADGEDDSQAAIGYWSLANLKDYRFDDLVIASFVSGPGSSTLPIVIFSKVRLGVTPEINALATVMIVVVAVAVIGASWAIRRRLSGRAQNK